MPRAQGSIAAPPERPNARHSAAPRGLDRHRGYCLSGGETQRLALARVILQDPRLEGILPVQAQLL